MTLRLEDKKAIVADVADIANKALSVVVADYRGLSVAEMTELRAKARNSGVYLRVVRNTLARRAIQDTDFACLDESLVGPLCLAFSMEEPGAAARLIRDFTKGNDKLEVKVLALSGQLMAADKLKALADLPSKDEAIAMLLSVMLAPVTKFVRTVAEPYAKLTRTFAAVRDNKQAA